MSVQDNNLIAIDSVLTDYMGKKVDYALLLDGEWGSGKTFYCRNHLKEVLNKNKRDSEKIIFVINVSLFGKTNIEEINWDFTLSLLDLIKIKGFGKKLFQTVKTLIDQAFGNKLVTSLLSAAGFLSKAFIKGISCSFKKIKKETQILLVFDDLERCKENLLIDLLGQINSEFIEKGYHVLFVANKSKISNCFNNEKIEKIIRSNIQFKPNLLEALVNIVQGEVFTGSPIYKLYIEQKEHFEVFIKRFITVSNLRTWQYIFDNYNLICSKVEEKVFIEFKFQLLCIVLIETDFYCKNGYILCLDSDIDYDNKQIPNEITDKKKLIKDTYCVDIIPVCYGREFAIITNIKKSDYKYASINSIKELVCKGYFDKKAFVKEFEMFFPSGNEYERAYLDLSSFHSLDENDFKVAFENVIEGIKNDAFFLNQIINLANLLCILEKEGYLALCEEVDYETLILNQLSKETLLVSEEQSFLERRINDCCDFIKQRLIDILNNSKHHDFENDRFLELYDTFDRVFYNELDGIFKVRLFERISINNKIISWLDLPLKALMNLQAYVDDIYQYESDFGKSGCCVYYSERKFMEKALIQINKELSNCNQVNKINLELRYLANNIEKTIKLLNETHERKITFS